VAHVLVILPTIYSNSKLLDPINQLQLCYWLNFPLDKLLELVPEILNEIEIRRFWHSLPPVHTLLFSKIRDQIRSMFWIINLQGLVALREFITDKWKQANLKDVNKQWGIHDGNIYNRKKMNAKCCN